MFQTILEATELPTDYKDVMIIGKVVVNDDSGEPDGKKCERIKVFIPGLYDDPDTSKYPWCWPKQPTLFGSGAGFGPFGVPDLNSFVVIELKNGDPSYPIYVGGILLDGNQVAEAGTNYPNRYGFKDSAGNLFYVDKTSGEIKVHHKSGTEIKIASNGDVDVNAGGQNITAEGHNITATASQDITATASAGTITANALNVTATATAIATLNGATVNITATGVLTLTAASLSLAIAGTSTFSGGGSVDLSGATSVKLP
jgi:phage baseplate assembly protein gpV